MLGSLCRFFSPPIESAHMASLLLVEDTINGFLLNMDKSVDVFATKVRADPRLAKGFYAFGLSQGNNLIHGSTPRSPSFTLQLAFSLR